MNMKYVIAPAVVTACRELEKAMKGTLGGTKLQEIQDTINGFAIASAVACFFSGVVPGAAGVVAVLAQAGFVWATYLKINGILGLSFSENIIKTIASAILTNLVVNAGTLLLAGAASTVLSFVPGIGSAIAAAINCTMGYVVIFVSAVLYLKLITKMAQDDGTIMLDESDSTKDAIKNVVKDADLGALIAEGKDAYNQAKADGSIDSAKKNPKCPVCSTKYKPGQKYCNECGNKLM